MKIDEKNLDQITPITFYVAVAAWLGAILATGRLYRSALYALLMAAAGGAYMFGFIKLLDLTHSYS